MKNESPGTREQADGWQVTPLTEVWQQLGSVEGRPFLVALDGHSGAGKSTFAARLAAARPGTVVLHTDDIAWHHSFFDWHENLAEHVLRPLRRGEAVCHRPQSWQERGRDGAIEVPAGTRAVIVEGSAPRTVGWRGSTTQRSGWRPRSRSRAALPGARRRGRDRLHRVMECPGVPADRGRPALGAGGHGGVR